MLEASVPQRLPEIKALFLNLLKLITSKQTDKTVSPLVFLSEETE